MAAAILAKLLSDNNVDVALELDVVVNVDIHTDLINTIQNHPIYLKLFDLFPYF